MQTRQERDAFGTVEVPADRYWGAQTQRALSLFRIGTEKLPPSLTRAIGLQKLAAARANARLKELPAELVEAITQAAREVADGRFDDHFPLPVWQIGSGTATNMNANEVIANRANELLGQPLGTKNPVHPNDHINRGQSSNDTFPTVMHIVTVLELKNRLIPALRSLQGQLAVKAEAWKDIVKIARTHLQDATPMTLGQGFAAMARQVELGIGRVEAALENLYPLAQGGTAVGTGLNAKVGFDTAFAEELSKLTGLPFTANPNKFEGMGAHDALMEASGVLNTVAVSLTKIANDIRFLGAGPRAGHAELVLPHDGLTSSIMPGKRNPTLAEALLQVCYQVMGNHVAVTHAAAAGHFELNVAKPVIVHNILQSITLMADAAELFGTGMIAGIEPNTATLQRNVEHSIMLATALNPHLGYDKVAQIVNKAFAEGTSPKQAAIDLGYLSAEEYDRLADPRAMLGPRQ
ncbi:MAG TPA: class II fumarate hydratase [Ferrovibrio sp.]|jgi:fumarate hydratase class II|uniref:class II fumarate hydratase n=1 Tax=Ferrovibrio sp. TaxID=1917215 RepID=UPI002B4B7F67|nr:class II fumarate hydratase [Ferrovibrio sp.]HLT77731.1 class II fumarate hydratase [Ferrovibrio sp.]